MAVLTARMPLDGEYAPSPRGGARAQAELYERTDGEQGNLMAGKPIVVVTSRGAITGKLRKTPLMRVEHDGAYAAIASYGGAPSHPVWYHNLIADPHVELQDGPTRCDMRARLASGSDRSTWWQRAVDAYPPYASYQTKTKREIPVFVLEPIDP